MDTGTLATLDVIDVRDPNDPVRISRVETEGWFNDVKVIGGYAFITGSTRLADVPAGALFVVDIGDNACPLLHAVCTTETAETSRVEISGDLAMLGSRFRGKNFRGSQSLTIFNIGNIATPRPVCTKGPIGTVAAITGHHAYAAASNYLDGWPVAELTLLDISNPAQPVVLAESPYVDVRDIQVRGGLLYVAAGTDGVSVLHLPHAFEILQHPHSMAILPGQSATLHVAAFATGSLTYQWYLGESGDTSVPIPGATLPSLPTAPTWQTARYWVRVSSGRRDHRDSNTATVIPKATAVRRSMGSWPGYARGPALDVSLVGNRAYVLDGLSGFHILDITERITPRLIGVYSENPTPISHLAVNNDSVYAWWNAYGGEGWLTVVDVSDPGHPGRLIDYSVLDSVLGIAGPYVFIRAEDTLAFASLRDPTHIAGTCAIGVETEGPYFTLCMIGDLLYVAGGVMRGALEIHDLSNPENPRLLGRCLLEEYEGPMGMCVTQGKAFILDTYHSLILVDVRDPTRPRRVGTTPLYTPWEGVVSYGLAGADGLVYVAKGRYNKHAQPVGGVLSVIDWSISALPTEVARLNLAGVANRVRLYDEYAFVCETDVGVEVFDVSSPTNPLSVGRVDTSWGQTKAVQAVGQVAYVADGEAGVAVLDISDPVRPIRIGQCNTPGQALDISVVGSIAYVACGQQGIAALDISINTQPVILASVFTGGNVLQISALGSLAFAKHDTGRLTIVDVRNASAPIVLSDLPGVVSDFGVMKDRLVVCDQTAAVEVFDLADPTQPRGLGKFEQGHFTDWSVDVVGSLVFVSAAASTPTEGYGLRRMERVYVLDVNGNLLDSMTEGAVYTQGAYAYMRGVLGGWDVLDLSDPAHPVGVGELGSTHSGICASGTLALSAQGAWGLTVERIAPAPFFTKHATWVGDGISLSWTKGPGVKLEATADLTNPDWHTVAGSENVDFIEVSTQGAQLFFRLSAP